MAREDHTPVDGARLKAVRHHFKMTVPALAKVIGLSRAQIGSIENGRAAVRQIHIFAYIGFLAFMLDNPHLKRRTTPAATFNAWMPRA